MRSLLWLPLTSLLVLGCKDSPDKVTAPAADVPNGEVNLDKIAANAATAAALGPAARCVRIVYLSEANVLRTKQRGTGCSCLSGGRQVSVTAVVWNGAAGNNVIGRAYCGSTLVAGPATALDPGGGALGVASVVNFQFVGAPGCQLLWTVSAARDRSNRLVSCVFH